MRRALFLDLDGVVNCNEHLNSLSYRRDVLGEETGLTSAGLATMIEPAMVERINRIVDGLDVQIVLSSSWRVAYPLGLIRRAMKERGLVSDIRSTTPHMPGGDRAREIRAWLDQQYTAIDKFVILDDQPDAGFGMMRWFVQTDPEVGLTDEDAARAREILT